jgi:hypothetical protein
LALEADWQRTADSSIGRAAVRRWATADPALEGATSGHDVLAMCRERGEQGWPGLTALLRLAADDEFAQQTVLQALLPGLLDLSRRARSRATDAGSAWVDEDELEQEVVVIAFERIRALAGTTEAWPASNLLHQTWRRLRTVLQGERRHRRVHRPLPPGVEVASAADRSPAEHLAQLVVDAVQEGRLAQEPAQLFYARRVLGDSLNSLVPVSGLSRWTLRERIAGSAQVLADAS